MLSECIMSLSVLSVYHLQNEVMEPEHIATAHDDRGSEHRVINRHHNPFLSGDAL